MAASRRRSRKEGTRAQRKRVLIVTEGETSEPTYFLDVCADYNLGSVVVDGSCDPDPESVVQYGLQRYTDEDFDRLYCVFDRDQHAHFGDALDTLQSARHDDRHDVYWIYSIPCFETWIWFHFENSGRDCTHPSSPCGVVIDEVENHISSYSKGSPDVYKKTKHRLSQALQTAKTRWGADKGSGYDNYRARTKIFKLIDDLQDMSPR